MNSLSIFSSKQNIVTALQPKAKQNRPRVEQIGCLAHWNKGEHAPRGTPGVLSKRVLDRIYYMIWALIKWFRGKFMEDWLYSGLDAVGKWGQFYDGLSFIFLN